MGNFVTERQIDSFRGSCTLGIELVDQKEAGIVNKFVIQSDTELKLVQEWQENEYTGTEAEVGTDCYPN